VNEFSQERNEGTTLICDRSAGNTIIADLCFEDRKGAA
jgi:hypothetical protein